MGLAWKKYFFVFCFETLYTADSKVLTKINVYHHLMVVEIHRKVNLMGFKILIQDPPSPNLGKYTNKKKYKNGNLLYVF